MFVIPNKKLLVFGGKTQVLAKLALELRIVDNTSASVTLVLDRLNAPDLEEPVRLPMGEVAPKVITCPLDFFDDVLLMNPKDVKISQGIGQKEIDCHAELACFRMLWLVRIVLQLNDAGTGVYIDEVSVAFKKSSIQLHSITMSDAPEQEFMDRYFTRL